MTGSLLFLSCQDFCLGLWCHHSNKCHIHCFGWEGLLNFLRRMAFPFSVYHWDSPEIVHVWTQRLFWKEAVLELVSLCVFLWVVGKLWVKTGLPVTLWEHSSVCLVLRFLFCCSLLISLVFLTMLQSMRDLGSWSSQESNLRPLLWKCGILTTGLQGSPQAS